MSIKVPKESVEYQSHNHCQCDFCSSRRCVNAKQSAVSQRLAHLQHAKLRNGCCCRCHDALNATSFAATHGGNTAFDPEYPEPVNQTALNASRGRVGAPNGTTLAGSGMGPAGTRRTKEEEAQDAMDELDRLERLLILEHKARINATLEADRIGTLRDGAAATTRGPLPLPADYLATLNGGESAYPAASSGQFGGSYKGETIREAYHLAHGCPTVPPVQCGASHRLHDTMNDLRLVTMDPVNPAGRQHLQRVLEANGVVPPSSETGDQRRLSRGGSAGSDGSAPANEFGNSLAKNRSYNPHPYGAGVVWTKKDKQRAVTVTTKTEEEHRPDGNVVTTTTKTKTVTYAV